MIYGMPSSDLFLAERRGEVLLGGCCVLGDIPPSGLYACRRCGWQATLDDNGLLQPYVWSMYSR